MTNVTTSAPTASTETPALYRVSALFFGFLRMWRGWKVVLPTLVLNALIQALLILVPVGDGFSGSFMATVFVSAIVILLTACALPPACLEATTGKVPAAAIQARLVDNLGRFSITIVVLAVAVMIGLGIYTWPGLLIAAVFPFVAVAAMDGKRNPAGANFKVIAARPFRWLVTMLIIGGFALLTWLLMAVNGFFVPSWVGAFAACLAGGLLAWWWQASLALIYRSAMPIDSTEG